MPRQIDPLFRAPHRGAHLFRAVAKFIGKGDILVLPEWDRATRSMLDGVHMLSPQLQVAQGHSTGSGL